MSATCATSAAVTQFQVGRSESLSQTWLLLAQALMDSEDWDPDAYDAAMQSAFGEDYYDVNLAAWHLEP